MSHSLVVYFFYPRHEYRDLPLVLLLQCPSGRRGEAGEMDDVIQPHTQMAVDRPRDVVEHGLSQSLGTAQREPGHSLKEDMILLGPCPLLCLPESVER